MVTMIRKLSIPPDPRLVRRDVILQELRTPERLTDEQMQALFKELAELQADLDGNPPAEVQS